MPGIQTSMFNRLLAGTCYNKTEGLYLLRPDDPSKSGFQDFFSKKWLKVVEYLNVKNLIFMKQLFTLFTLFCWSTWLRNSPHRGTCFPTTLQSL